ncbi:MAG: DUF5667 domain-containing protein [Patescibacteria group bacterium]
MEDQELAQKLSLLKRIKPRQDWVMLTRARIFKEEPSQGRLISPLAVLGVLRYYCGRPAFVMPVLAVLVFGGILVQSAQKSMPGDTLYAVRSLMERAQYQMVVKDPALANLELASFRLQDLRQIAESNKVENLEPAIREFQESVVAASEDLNKLAEAEPRKALQVQVKEKLVQLGQERTAVEQILGAAIADEESEGVSKWEEAIRKLVERELADAGQSTLSEDQEVLLGQIEQAAEEQDYEKALQLLLELGA